MIDTNDRRKDPDCLGSVGSSPLDNAPGGFDFVAGVQFPGPIIGGWRRFSVPDFQRKFVLEK